ncbi:MAG: metallophosphoesterase [Bacteroidales bacterium]|jgi:predicted phosphohydrolase|nr:metallophosphoesterase [Bacteroidales bacterium]
MKLQYASDLHLEFPENREFLRKNPLLPGGDVLLLAGDIVPFAVMDKHADFFSYISDNFETTYWIPGNHEYYNSDISTRTGSFNEKIKENLFLVNNVSVLQENVKFIFSTLWTNISASNQFEIRQRLSDFHTIKYNNRGLTPDHYNFLHEQCHAFLNDEISKDGTEKKVVITHHVPTFMNYPEKYKGDSLNEAFAVEMYNDILRLCADFWIFGHHHCNTPDFQIGTTTLATNQLGYVKYDDCPGFSTKKIITIDND